MHSHDEVVIHQRISIELNEFNGFSSTIQHFIPFTKFRAIAKRWNVNISDASESEHSNLEFLTTI